MSRTLACFARPIAHRGLHGCGHGGPVENTIGAARAAIEAGYAIECDVQLSKDGEAMVFHDDRLDRLTATRGSIGDLALRDLTRVRLEGCGETIPTLPSFLAAIGGRVPLVIEIKTGPAGDFRLVDRVLDLVATYAGSVVVESFDPAIVARCRRAPCPVGLVGPSEATDARPSAPDCLGLARCDFVSWSIDHLASIPDLYAALPLTTWTVRTPGQNEVARCHGAQIVFEGFEPPTQF